MKTAPIWLVHLSLVFVSLIYGANYSIAKEIIPVHLAPATMILVRVLGATLIFWLIWLVSKKQNEVIPNRRDLRYMALCGLFGIVANQLLFFKGLSLTSPVNASVIMITTPILVFIASVLISGERITGWKIAGVLLGGFGALMIIGGGSFSFARDKALGDFLVFLNATCYGIYLVLVRPMMKKYPALTLIRWVFTLALLPVIIFVITEHLIFERLSQQLIFSWANIPLEIYAAIAFVVLATTVIVYFLNAWAIDYVGSTVVGFYIYLQPVMASFFAIIFGMNDLTLAKVLYAFLVFAGALMVSYATANPTKIKSG